MKFAIFLKLITGRHVMLIRLKELVGSPEDYDFESATFVQNIRMTGCLGTTILYDWDSLKKHVGFEVEQRLPGRITIKIMQKNILRHILNTNFLCVPLYKINRMIVRMRESTNETVHDIEDRC